jgi:transcriptional regulator with XRE-family HTH domain
VRSGSSACRSGRSSCSTRSASFGDRIPSIATIDRLASAGSLGKKSGLGFYRYEKGKRAGANPTLAAPGAARDGQPPMAEIQNRLVDAMVNEAALALDEGVVARPDDVDLAMVYGTGFPPFRGGLLRHADTVGIGAIVERLAELERTTKRAAAGRVAVQRAADGGDGDGDGTQIRFSPAWVRKHRGKLGMSRLLYARLLGVSPQTIMGWEQGRSRPRRKALQAWRAMREMRVRELKARIRSGADFGAGLLGELGAARPRRARRRRLRAGVRRTAAKGTRRRAARGRVARRRAVRPRVVRARVRAKKK